MIDIIIPVYNSHDTINTTLFSIGLQTIKDKVNVYLVDDCSKKGYAQIVKEFSKKLNINELTMKKNGGPGVARQFGIDNSSGEYILFIDSDDLLIDCFSLENIYKMAKSANSDIAVGIMIDETDTGNFEYPNHQGNLHGKLYKRKFLVQHNIRFNSARTSEDNSFNRLVLACNPRHVFVPHYICFYRNNKNSITQKDGHEYAFHSIEDFTKNIVWLCENMERRHQVNIYTVECIYTSCLYVYKYYIYYRKKSDVNLILRWFKPLKDYYDKYSHQLTPDLITYHYHEGFFGFLPEISFREFLYLTELHT